MQKGKILAIDYGQKSIGLAVSDQDRMMAFGRGVLKNSDKEVVLAKLADLIVHENVNELIVGLPMGQSGEETSQTTVIRTFAAQLENHLKTKGINLPIGFLDESFSSFEANNRLAEIGVKSPDRKKTEDEMAAIILIHRFIDFRP